MIQAIFFDIDGTLASFQTHQVSRSTFQTLKALKKQGIKLFIATGRGKDGLDILILSRLVDTFFSRISLTMPPAPKSHNTACVLPQEEPLHWQSRSSGYSSS